LRDTQLARPLRRMGRTPWARSIRHSICSYGGRAQTAPADRQLTSRAPDQL